MLLSRPLRAFALFTAAWSFNPTSGLWILYLLHCHWTLFEVGIGEGGFHLVMFVAQVPTGLFADRCGRRASLAAGLAIHVASSILLWLVAPHHLVLGLLTLAFSALSWSFIGGADQALLYGLVQREFGENAYGRIYGTCLSLHLVSGAVAIGLGGWMVFAWGWSGPFLVASGMGLLAMASLTAIPEHRIPLEPVISWARLSNDLRLALTASGRVPGLRLLIACGAGMASLVTISNLYAQSTLVSKGASVRLAVTLIAAAGLVTALGSLWAGRRTRPARLPQATTLLGLALAAVGVLPLRGTGPSYLTAAGLDGVIDQTYATVLSHAIPEQHRAAILSLPDAGFSLLMVVLFPLAGWIMTRHHLRAVYLALAGGMLAVSWILRHTLQKGHFQVVTAGLEDGRAGS